MIRLFKEYYICELEANVRHQKLRAGWAGAHMRIAKSESTIVATVGSTRSKDVKVIVSH